MVKTIKNTSVRPMSVEQPSTAVALTGRQRARLLLGCLPFPIFIVVDVALATSLRGMLGPRAPWVIGLAVLITLTFARQALQRLRDVRLGVALVAEDRLVQAGAGGGGANAYGARFERLGHMRVLQGSAGMRGQRYRIRYSPSSRFIWDLEPLRY